MRISPFLFASVFASSLLSLPSSAKSQTFPLRTYLSDEARSAAHASPDWKLIEPHLPDPETSPTDVLETQGDLLRARRFPEDALDYYGYAMKRGGDPANLLNKIGITELEVGNPKIARAFFDRVVKMRRNDPQAWNNLGAVEFLNRNYSSALRNYKRAIKLDKHLAVSHSNLGMAYVELKDLPSANKEFATALKLDPGIFQHSSSAGVTLHMLSTKDRADFCFEMAKVYAHMGNETEMIHQLQMASEAGLDVQYQMSKTADLAKYTKDPRVVRLVMVAKSLRASRNAGNNVATALAPAAEPAAVPVAR